MTRRVAQIRLDQATIQQQRPIAGRRGQSQLHQYRVTGGWHRGIAQRGRGPDGRRQLSDADAVPGRAGHHQDADRRQCQRGRHRPSTGRTDVEFSVDAFPNRVFQGQSRRCARRPITSRTWSPTTSCSVDNPELLLLPGMTADDPFYRCATRQCAEGAPARPCALRPAGWRGPPRPHETARSS